MKLFNRFRREVKKFLGIEEKRLKGPVMIAIKDLYKNFGNNKVLRGIDLEVKKGEIVAIIGPSGCGKSTLLKLIIRLEKPTSGTILVGGENMAELDEEVLNLLRQRIGMVFQSSALFDSLTVAENVSFGLREHTKLSEREIRKIVAEKLETVGLEGSENLMPAELSGGMQKRVGLARALATNPEIILYDEPTTGLDPIIATQIEELMNKLHKRLNVTAIMVTHQLSTVYRTANRILMLHEGKLIEAGTPEETQRTSNPVIKQFITGSVS